MKIKGKVCQVVEVYFSDESERLCSIDCPGFLSGKVKYDFCTLFIDENTNRWMVIERGVRHWKCQAHFRQQGEAQNED